MAVDLLKSRLFEREEQQGALFDVLHGWEMPRVFSDATQEHEAVRNAAGLIDLTNLGALTISGGEAIQFLNGLVTNDVKTLDTGRWMRAAFLTGHGKVRALCLVLKLDGSFLIVNDAQTHKKVFDYVFPFSYAGDFQVADTSDSHRVLTIQGPSAQMVMKEVAFEPIASLEESHWTETTIAGCRVIVLRNSRTGEIGYDILAPNERLSDIWDFILLKGEFHSLKAVGFEALDSLRLEAGIPVYGIDVDESNMFLEVGLDDAVSFTKGCYTGQEAVAMATYRGHVSKRLTGLMLEGDRIPAVGDSVLSESREIGKITSALRSATLNHVIALAYLKFGHFEPDNRIAVLDAEREIEGVTTKLPFYKAINR
jgi:glycine cleavage system T protein (aminomethyltransferase)